MPATYWIKLYDEILDDPKMARLPDHLWRRVTECFLFAGREHANGFLPPVEDMAWTLRCSEEELARDLAEIAERTGILEKRDGMWFVVQFESRQARVSDAERQSRRRVRQRDAQYYGERHEGVTSRDTSCHEGVTSRDVDTDTDAEADAEVDAEAEAEPAPAAARSASAIYAQIARIEPAPELARLIERHVGHDPPDLERWESVVREWILQSWKPGNVSGMLDYFERQELPGDRHRRKAERPSGRNGSGEGYLEGVYADIIRH